MVAAAVQHRQHPIGDVYVCINNRRPTIIQTFTGTKHGRWLEEKPSDVVSRLLDWAGGAFEPVIGLDDAGQAIAADHMATLEEHRWVIL